MSKRVSFHTFGCKLNFAETATIQRDMVAAGYEQVSIRERADVVVINTCSVTEEADKKCASLVRQVRRRSSTAKVVLVGCYAQLQSESLSSNPSVDYVLGTAEKFSLPAVLAEHPHGARVASAVARAQTFLHAHSQKERTRAFLKVQDGCDYGCSFCTIPLARGVSRSASVTSLVDRAEQLAAEGVREIVLTGVNIGDFGMRLGKRTTHFLTLLQALEGIKGRLRYRISSIEPNLLHDEIITFVAQSHKFVPHFHIPLQSGADDVLKKMRRRYLTTLYEHRVRAICEAMPDASVGADVIAGFPGEEFRHFSRTLNFLQGLSFSYLHVFPYSPRKNTLAATLPSQVPVVEKKRRVSCLRALSEQKKKDFYTRQLGRKRRVLFEKNQKNGKLFGFTDNYIRVAVPYRPRLAGEMLSVFLETLHADGYVSCSL